MDVCISWANLRNEQSEMEHLAPELLDEHLQLFKAEVKKKDGSNYELFFQANMQAALCGYLNVAGHK